MKLVFSSFDLLVAVAELREKLIGFRVNQIYDVNPKTYLIKLANQNEDDKPVLIIESGFRIHSTEFSWPKNTMPSGFSMKLRKHIKNRRLTAINQVGCDRIVDLQFGSDEGAYHIIAELYAKGNICLTDKDYKILNILRPRTDANQDVRFAVHERYPLELAQQFPLTMNRIMQELCPCASLLSSWNSEADQMTSGACCKSVNKKRQHELNSLKSELISQLAKEISSILLEKARGQWQSQSKDNQQLLPPAKVISSTLGISSEVVEHIVRKISVDTYKPSSESEKSGEKSNDLNEEGLSGEEASLSFSTRFSTDFIALLLELHTPLPQNKALDNDEEKKKEKLEQNVDATSLKLKESTDESSARVGRAVIFGKQIDQETAELTNYTEFHPVHYLQHKQKLARTFPSFNKAVDEFFSKLETQKLDRNLHAHELKALKKTENFKKDHVARLENLQSEKNLNIRRAQLIEMNMNLVDRAILMVNHALSNKIDWNVLETMIKEASERGDLIASSIVNLQLNTNQFTLHLKDPYIDEEEENTHTNESSRGVVRFDNDTISQMDVLLDLAETAANNAKRYYDLKRAGDLKANKTIEASEKALKSAQRKARQAMKDVKTVSQINKVRKVLWFEKFHWFISSENYIVVAGRDSHQNEVLVKRYLMPGDIYVHADVHGASSVIVKARPLLSCDAGYQSADVNSTNQLDPVAGACAKGPSSIAPVPIKTLNEAGNMAIVLSAAWQARIITSAWWVYHDQVSKTAPTGEYLTPGAFMIRGKKNYLPPCHLTYGFGIMFRLSEESVESHVGERRIITSTACHSTELPENENQEDDCERGGDKEINTNDKLTSLHDLPEPKNTKSQTDQQCLSANKGAAQQKGNNKQKQQKQNNSNKNKEKKNYNVETSCTGRKPRDQYQAYLEDKEKSEANRKVSIDVSGDQPGSTNQKAQPNQPQLKRGQKKKLQKIKKKYADQDDEERAMRMKLLQGENAKPSEALHRLLDQSRKDVKTSSIQISNADENDAKEDEDKTSSSESKSDEDGEKSFSDDKSENVNTESDLHSEKNEGENSHQSESNTQKTEDEDADSTSEEENDPNEPGPLSESGKWSAIHPSTTIGLLNSLTGQPTNDDVLLYALPVCAPYSTLTNYKYKVKLIPGANKRGKAGKTILHHFISDKNITAREKDLLRAIKDQDISWCLPNGSKISLPGGVAFNKK